MKNISWINRVENEKLLQKIKEERDILSTIKHGRVTGLVISLRRNCPLKPVIEKKIDVTGRQGKRRKQLLSDLKEMRGCWKLKVKH
jgi:hypothetical protein